VSKRGTGDLGVGSWVERRARLAPERPAIVSGERSLTNAALAARVRRLANGLRGLGVGPGDRVAWLGPNHPAFLETLFAVGQLGAVLAPVNHRLGREVRAYVLAMTEPVVLLEHAMAEPTAAPSVRQRIVVGGAQADDAADYEALLAGSADEPVGETVVLDDLLMLPHTSGTTGKPKAVMLSHGNVTWNALNLLTSADFRGDDVTIAIAPFFRVGGTGVNVLPVVFVGGTVVVPEDPSPDELLRLMDQHRVTVGFGNPDLLDALSRAERWPTTDLSAVRFVITGGAPVPERLIRTWLERGVMLLQGYGLSEAGPYALLLDPKLALAKIGAAGKPPLLIDVRIADDHGRDVEAGRTGELWVRGPNVMAGYWRRPAESRRKLVAGGWLRTGDAARMDEDGDVWIVDRLEARFVSDGSVVYPGDVERVLMAHPAVADAGVVGVPAQDREEGGERQGRGRRRRADVQRVGTAFVVRSPRAAPTQDELLAFARGRLAAYQVPASITFVDVLPRNAVGKLLRDELARMSTGGQRPTPDG